MSTAEGGDSWGVSLALSDDANTLAMGSVDEDCTATGVNPPGCDTDQKTDVSTGAVAVFGRNGTTWSQQAYLKSSNTGIEDWFGIRVAISGDSNTLAVSAANEDSAAQGINGRQDDDSASEAGAVYLFTRGGNTWAQQAYVKSANNEAFDEFGNSSSALSRGRPGRWSSVARRRTAAPKGSTVTPPITRSTESGAAFVFTR